MSLEPSSRSVRHPARRDWGRWGFVLAAVLVVAVGCKPKPEVTATPAPDASTTNAANATPSAPPSNVINTPPDQLPQVNTSADGEPDLRDLNRYVLRWAIAHQRRPASFEEFATDPGVKIPPAPAGKKYVLDHTMHIILVNQ